MSSPRLRAFLGAAFSMLAFGAVAKETPPPAAPPRPIQIPASETITLENGLSATFIPFGQVPKVTIEAVVRTGELNAAGKPWLANIAGDLLHLGTANRSAEQISTDAASMGGDVSVGVGDDQSFVGIDVLSEDAPRAVALIGEVLTTPQLPESELARIRQDYLRNLSVERTQPQTLADEAFAGILYPQHPYGATLPTEEQLHAYTIADVKRYYDDNFGAVRTHIYVAGKFDRAAIEAAIRQAFGKWKAGAQPLVLPAKRGPAAVKFIDRPGAPQSTIRIGVRVLPPTDPEFMPLSVANTVLGGALTSRITLNIREQKGWAYSPSSTIEPKYHDAIWYEEADVKTEATAGAIREIFKEIDRLRSEPPSTSELESMKSYRNGGFVLSTATREGLMAQLAYMNLQELPASWLSTYVARLYAVTPAQVSESTRSQLDPKAMSVVVVGDLSKIRADVEQALREKHD